MCFLFATLLHDSVESLIQFYGCRLMPSPVPTTKTVVDSSSAADNLTSSPFSHEVSSCKIEVLLLRSSTWTPQMIRETRNKMASHEDAHVVAGQKLVIFTKPAGFH